MAVSSVAIDVSRGDEEQEQPALWVGIVCFGRVADSLLKHKQGDLISASGRVQMNRWKGQDGTDHEQLQVIADSLLSARAIRPGGGRRPAATGSTGSTGARMPYDDPLPF